MRRRMIEMKSTGCLMIFISLTSLGFNYQSAVWQKAGGGINEPAVLKLAVHPTILP